MTDFEASCSGLSDISQVFGLDDILGVRQGIAVSGWERRWYRKGASEVKNPFG